MHENVRVKSDNDLISVSLYKSQLAKNHMQSLASSPLLLNAGAENIPLPCLLMAPDLLYQKKTAEAVFSLAWETRVSMVHGRTAFTPGEHEFLIPSH